MTAGKTRILVAFVFVAALVGGAAAGLLGGRYVHPAGRAVVPAEASLSAELQLTPQQQAQIRQIWEGMRDENQKAYEDANAVDHWRDEQYQKLLTDQQKKQYQQIYNEYQNRSTEIDSKRKLAFDQAVEKTKRFLNDQQRQRYEQILARRLGTEGSIGSPPGSTHPAPTFSASAVSKGVESPE